MSCQRELPCLPTPACKGEAEHADPCSSCCSVVALDAPEQTSQVDPCPCQSAASCTDARPQVGSTCPPLAAPRCGDACCPEHEAALDSCASTCPAAISCDSPQSKGGANFPLQPTALSVEPCAPETVNTCVETFPFQHIIPTVELCPPEVAGTRVENFPDQQAISPAEPCTPVGSCMENIPLEYSVSAVGPCTIEVLEEPCCAQDVTIGDPSLDQSSVTRVDPCASSSAVCVEPCVSQSTTQPTETLSPQGAAGSGDTSSTKDTPKGASASPAPFRLHTRSAAIVERCLSRCQSWLRGKI